MPKGESNREYKADLSIEEVLSTRQGVNLKSEDLHRQLD